MGRRDYFEMASSVRRKTRVVRLFSARSSRLCFVMVLLLSSILRPLPSYMYYFGWVEASVRRTCTRCFPKPTQDSHPSAIGFHLVRKVGRGRCFFLVFFREIVKSIFLKLPGPLTKRRR